MPEEDNGKSLYMKCFYSDEDGLCHIITSSPAKCSRCLNWRSLDEHLKAKYRVGDVFIEMYDILSSDRRYKGFRE
ncbi:MAG: hypothetical protein N3F63_06785 [Thermoplasmata archaeon]|nr:hypothetical protein [Thermoplasmata archaeon]